MQSCLLINASHHPQSDPDTLQKLYVSKTTWDKNLKIPWILLSPSPPMFNYSLDSIDFTLECLSDYLVCHSIYHHWSSDPICLSPGLSRQPLGLILMPARALFALDTWVVFLTYPFPYLKFCSNPLCLWDYNETPHEDISKLLMI